MDDDIVIKKSLDGRIIYWSDSAAEAFGYTREEVMGRLVNLIIPFEWQDEEYEMTDRMRAGEFYGPIRTVRRAKDGKLLEADVTVTPIYEHGKIIEAAKLYRNLTPYSLQ